MQRTKLKAVVAAFVLVCASSITVIAASSSCAHSYKQVGVDIKGNWTENHYVAGPSGVETCTISHQEVRYYIQCSNCGSQYTIDDTIVRHNNPRCPKY